MVYFSCSAALASMAVLWLAPSCTVTIAVSRNGLISGNFFSFPRVPQIPFGVTLNWSLKNVSLIPRSADLKKIVFGGQKTFYIVSKCGPELVESVPREQYASSETVLRVLSPLCCLYGRSAAVNVVN